MYDYEIYPSVTTNYYSLANLMNKEGLVQEVNDWDGDGDNNYMILERTVTVDNNSDGNVDSKAVWVNLSELDSLLIVDLNADGNPELFLKEELVQDVNDWDGDGDNKDMILERTVTVDNNSDGNVDSETVWVNLSELDSLLIIDLDADGNPEILVKDEFVQNVNDRDSDRDSQNMI